MQFLSQYGINQSSAQLISFIWFKYFLILLGIFSFIFLGQGPLLLEQVAEISIQSDLEYFQGIVLNTGFFQCTFHFPAKIVTLLFLHLFTTSLCETKEILYTSHFLADKTQDSKVT